MSTIEKRRENRNSGESLVCFEGDNFSIFSKLHDFSDHGAFIATHYLLDPGTQVTLSFIDGRLKDKKRSAKVIHSSAAKLINGKPIVGLGLEFVGEA